MKENLNNNQTNKLNLPAAWTKKKMMSLFLMTWLSVNGTEAGQAFKNCLAVEDNDIITYNSLLNFDFASHPNITNGGILNVCCENSKCSLPPCVSSSGASAGCLKVNSLIFCRKVSPCRGVVGDSPISANTTLGGGCTQKDVFLNTLSNCLTTLPASSFTGLDKSYAYHYGNDPKGSKSPCFGPLSSPYFICNWDNGGWTCVTIDADADINKSCLLQWTAPWPGSVDKNPYPLSSTASSFSSTTSAVSSSATTTVVSIPISSSSDSIKKIFIPVGAAVGTITVGGITYYLYKRRKNKQNQQANNSDNNNQLFELANASRPTIKSGNTDQTIFVPTVIEPPESPRSGSLGMPVAWELATPTEEVNITEEEIQPQSPTTKSVELDQLIAQTKQKISPNLIISLETLLDIESEIARGNNTFALRQTQREAKKELQSGLSIQEINNLCQLQREVVQQEEFQNRVEVPPKYIQ
jgi:hypothetical protein